MPDVIEEIVVTAKPSAPSTILFVVPPPVTQPFPSSQPFPGMDIPSYSTVHTDNSTGCWRNLTGGIGWKSGSFGEPRASGPHKGIDIAAIVGTTVYAARSGWVVEATPFHEIVGPGEMATYGTAGNGNFVRIQDVHGGFHTYIHLQSVNVIVGEWVNSDQNIGRVNNTGSSTGNHLHYEYTDSSGTHQDPELEYAC